MKNKITVEAKLDEETVKKMIFVATAEGRSVNNHLLHLIRTNVAYYERVHGKITDKDLSKITVGADAEASEKQDD